MVIPQGSSSVAVIGAGILGASIAWRLACRGVQVTLIDKDRPGHGASSHSFAWINAGAKEPIGYHNLNRRSLEMWQRLAAAIGDGGDPESVGLRWGGKVSWESDAAAAEALAQRVRQLQSWGYPTRLIDAAELRELAPSLEAGPVAAAEYSPNEGQVEPQMVVDACLRRLEEMGHEVVVEAEVRGFEQDGHGRIQGLTTASGARTVDAVVLAAGTDTTRIAALAAVNVPQAESPGVVIRTDPQPPLLHNVPIVYAPPLGDGRREIHIRQCADGRLMIGEGDQESLAEDDSQAHADDLLARACRLPSGTQRRAGRSGAGGLAPHATGRLPGAGVCVRGAQSVRGPDPQRRHARARPEASWQPRKSATALPQTPFLGPTVRRGSPGLRLRRQRR